MKKWEYRSELIKPEISEIDFLLLDEFDKLGIIGWEFVMRNGQVFYFKREVEV
jgi:hypothetical protein